MTVKYNALHFPTYTFDQQFHIKALGIVTATSKYTKTSLPALFIRKKFTYLYIGQCIESTSFRQTKYHAVYELTLHFTAQFRSYFIVYQYTFHTLLYYYY